MCICNEKLFETPECLTLDGDVTAKVIENGGVEPTRIIRTDTGFTVDIDWELTGTAAQVLDGEFHVHVLLESMGPGQEYSLYKGNGPATPSRDNKYHVDFNVKPGEIGAAHEGTAYRMVVTITHRNSFGVPSAIAAFVDLGIFQFYNQQQMIAA